MKLDSADIDQSQDSALLASALLGCVSVFGVFNRITFPGFIFLPMLRLVPHYVRQYGIHPFAPALGQLT